MIISLQTQKRLRAIRLLKDRNCTDAEAKAIARRAMRDGWLDSLCFQILKDGK